MSKKENMIIAGGSGYLGNLLVKKFQSTYDIFILTRGNTKMIDGIHYINWQVDKWKNVINQHTTIINLSGKSINCLFTKSNNDKLISSRLNTTKLINKVINEHENPPKLFINASGISIYQSTLNPIYDEYNFKFGSDFLSQLSQKWEQTFFETATPKTRKVALRLAPVLGIKSNAIQSLIPVVKLGFGGKQGNGNQLFPFIHEQDFVNAVSFIINNSNINGSVNIIAPRATTNKKFMKVFRDMLSVKIGIPTPSLLLHLSKYFTKVEPEIILTSLYAKPTKLLENGFQFSFPTIDKTLQNILNNKA